MHEGGVLADAAARCAVTRAAMASATVAVARPRTAGMGRWSENMAVPFCLRCCAGWREATGRLRQEGWFSGETTGAGTARRRSQGLLRVAAVLGAGRWTSRRRQGHGSPELVVGNFRRVAHQVLDLDLREQPVGRVSLAVEGHGERGDE